MNRITGYIVILVLFVSAVSCGTEPKTQSKEKITIGMVTFPGYAPLYLARDQGFFGDLDVRLVRIESVGDLRAALSSGKIDMYASTYDIFQTNQGADVPGKGFLLIDESHGADGVVGADNIKTIADLKGKKLAGEPGLPPYFLLQYLLNKENLSLADISVKDIATQDAGAAFTSGSVDAAAIYEPFLSNSLKARKGSHLIASSAEAPNILADLLFASDKLTADRPVILKKVAAGWFRALDYIKSNPDDAYTKMAAAFNVSKQEMIDYKSVMTWYGEDDNMSMFNRNSPVNVYRIFQQVGDVLERNGSAKKRFRPEDKLTDAIITQMKNEKTK